MARARNIKPGFFSNDLLAEIEPLGRILFAGIWTIADRAGRVEDRVKKIKASCLPYDDCDCDALLQELHKHGFILRYSVDGTAYIQVVKWDEHQNPHIKEAESTIPAPYKNSASQEQDTTQTGTSPADSLNPITDSLNPQPSSKKVAAVGFDEFWTAYPKKVGKEDASKAFAKLNPDTELLQTILTAIENNRRGAAWMKDGGEYVPNPATWLNGKRWTDEVKPYEPQKARASPASQADQAAINARNNAEAKRLLFGKDEMRTIDA